SAPIGFETHLLSVVSRAPAAATKLFFRGSDQTKPDVIEAIGREIKTAMCRPAYFSVIEPAAATENAIGTGIGPLRIRARATLVIFRIVPILHPLGNIPKHVM